MTEVGFARVNALPPAPEPGTLYFVKRSDNSMDVVLAGTSGEGIYSRRPHVDMVIESTPGLLPPDAVIGRYMATCPLEFLGDISRVVADDAATNESVCPVLIGAVVVARARFPAGEAEAVIEIFEPLIAAPALLIFKTPALQDPTLSGVVGTFAARRT